jgi:addiction module HigA family antidote
VNEKTSTAFALMTNGGYVSIGRPGMRIMLKLQIIIRRPTMTNKNLPSIHPGEILLEEFLRPMGISQYRLAKDISVSPRRINEIVHGKRAITADTALRLGRFFGMSPQFWLNLQNRYDLEVTEDMLVGRLDKEVHALNLHAA